MYLNALWRCERNILLGAALCKQFSCISAPLYHLTLFVTIIIIDRSQNRLRFDDFFYSSCFSFGVLCFWVCLSRCRFCLLLHLRKDTKSTEANANTCKEINARWIPAQVLIYWLRIGSFAFRFKFWKMSVLRLKLTAIWNKEKHIYWKYKSICVPMVSLALCKQHVGGFGWLIEWMPSKKAAKINNFW